jgi:flagellar assembly factor FliW
MKVATSRFGEIEVPDESLIRFPDGIIGFKDCTRFVIFDCGEEGLFKWLQSADRPDVAFVICEAAAVVPDYQIVIGQQEADLLQLTRPADAVICLILCIPDDPREVTANLLGPIVFNSETRIGMQMVLLNPDYSTKHRIFAPAEDTSGDAGEEGGSSTAAEGA